MLNSNYVPGWLHPEREDFPSLWFIGEAPGSEEDIQRKPLVGPAGRLHRRVKKEALISDFDIFEWNIFHKRPPGNAEEFFYKDRKAGILTPYGEAMVEELRKLILCHRPILIVALGSTATEILCGKKPISKWRGSILPCVWDDKIKIYPTYHPSFVLRSINEKGESKKEKGAQNVYPTVVRDYKRAAYQSLSRDWHKTHRTYQCSEDSHYIISYIRELRKSNNTLSCDIETIPFSDAPPIITRIGIGKSPTEAISIPLTKNGILRFTIAETANILKELSELFLQPNRTWVFQNGLYDLVILAHVYKLRLHESSTIEDTMFAHQAMYSYLPKGLDYIASCYTWEPYYKSIRGTRNDAELSVYNAHDCCITLEVWEKLKPELHQGGFLKGYKRTCSLYPVLLYMMLQGVKVNPQVMEELKNEFSKEIMEAEEKVYELAGEKFNINSTRQLGAILYERLGLPMQGRTTSGNYKTDKRTRAILARTTKHPIFNEIDNVKKLSKYISSYCNIEFSADGRIRVSYDPSGTVTWRLATSKSNLGGGTNITTIPKRDKRAKKLRRMFVADSGYCFIQPDLAQAEDRVVVYKAGDLEGIKDYESGIDTHWKNACRIFNWPLDKVYNPNDEEHWIARNLVGKVCKHADNYLMGPKQFYRELILNGLTQYSYHDSQILQYRQKQARPMIAEWQAWVFAEICKPGHSLTTCLGRKRVFAGRLDNPETHKKACAFEPQSTVGELMLIYLKRLHEKLNGWHGFSSMMTSHDDVVVQCKENFIAEVAKEMKRIMVYPLHITDIYGKERILNIPTDFKVGYNWYDLKDWDVEKGDFK